MARRNGCPVVSRSETDVSSLGTLDFSASASKSRSGRSFLIASRRTERARFIAHRAKIARPAAHYWQQAIALCQEIEVSWHDDKLIAKVGDGRFFHSRKNPK